MLAGGLDERSGGGADMGLLGILWGLASKPGARALFIAAAVANLVASVALPLLVGLDPTTHSVLGRMGDTSAPCVSRITFNRGPGRPFAARPTIPLARDAYCHSYKSA